MRWSSRTTKRVLATSALIGGIYTGNAFHTNTALCRSGDHTELLNTLSLLAPVIDAPSMLEEFVTMMAKQIEQTNDTHVSLDQLTALFRNCGVEDDAIAGSIFRIMDWDNNGYLDQAEVAAVLTLFHVGADTERFRFLFKCLDLDGGGSVDKDEFRRMLTALLDAKYHLHGLFDPREPDEYFVDIVSEEFHTVAKLHANRIVRDIFLFADKNKDGELSMKEFLHWCKRGGREVNLVSELLGNVPTKAH